MLMIEDDEFITIAGSISSLFNGIAKIWCGSLIDKYKIKTIMFTSMVV